MHLKLVPVAMTYFSLPGCKILPKAQTLNPNHKGVCSHLVLGDSSVESTNTNQANHLGLKLSYNENFMLS